MSFWINGKDSSGRSTKTSFYLPFELVFVLLGLVAAWLFPIIRPISDKSAIAGILLMLAGFSLFLSAKILQFRSGVWIAWVTKNLPIFGKILYGLGYVVMLIGFVFALVKGLENY